MRARKAVIIAEEQMVGKWSRSFGRSHRIPSHGLGDSSAFIARSYKFVHEIVPVHHSQSGCSRVEGSHLVTIEFVSKPVRAVAADGFVSNVDSAGAIAWELI